jgi:hypothetical protein
VLRSMTPSESTTVVFEANTKPRVGTCQVASSTVSVSKGDLAISFSPNRL